MKKAIRVDGDKAFVPLTKGYEAVIDAADIALVEEISWYAKAAGNTVYAAGKDYSGPKPKTVYLHRLILAPTAGLDVDHINLDALDNRRHNLRLATHAENQRNKRPQSNNTSGFKGVVWVERQKRWRAAINVAGVRRYLGCFDTAEAAHGAYRSACAELHGNFGRAA